MAQQRHHSMFNMMPADVFLTRLYQEQESDGEGRGDGEGGEVLEGLRVGAGEPGRLIILVQRAHYLAEFCRVLKFWTRHDTAPGEAVCKLQHEPMLPGRPFVGVPNPRLSPPSCLPSISDPDTMARQQPHFMNYMTLADVFLTRP
ncbi:hypothetical protein O3P69_013120 [Scylla paramamosain]|uniref:Uncharacterized protein n=1 Tax=Scylla paramamosain TaxID=85552 RepID=A0AAW0TZH0_SCYPA